MRCLVILGLESNHVPRCEPQSRPFTAHPEKCLPLLPVHSLSQKACLREHLHSLHQATGESEMTAASEVISGEEPRRGLCSQCCRLRSLRAGLHHLFHNQTGFGLQKARVFVWGDHLGSHTAFETLEWMRLQQRRCRVHLNCLEPSV